MKRLRAWGMPLAEGPAASGCGGWRAYRGPAMDAGMQMVADAVRGCASGDVRT